LWYGVPDAIGYANLSIVGGSGEPPAQSSGKGVS
jgi:hypothetical protein